MGWKQAKAPFSRAFLKAHLHYSPRTGRWKRLTKKNSKAGHYMRQGYLRMRIGGKRYLAHVLAWFYMTGRWPQKMVDHQDNDPTNLKWQNLRLASWTQNRVNSKCRSDNKSKYKGTHEVRPGRYQALICYKGVRESLGHFSSAKKAHAAYVSAARKRFGRFARAA